MEWLDMAIFNTRDGMVFPLYTILAFSRSWLTVWMLVSIASKPSNGVIYVTWVKESIGPSLVKVMNVILLPKHAWQIIAAVSVLSTSLVSLTMY